MATIQCPTCSGAFDSEHSNSMPFCSERCRQIDLGQWLNEQMGVPIDPDPDEDPGFDMDAYS
jgi:endogenous inhibitor of DNA gyrase (YacG/DUF329 family)